MRLTGLQPNTRYYYSVGGKQTSYSGNDNTTYFTTPPITGRARATRIWALGSFGQWNSGQWSSRDAYYSYTGTRDTDMVLMLGDHAYSSGTDAEYQTSVFDTYPTLLRRAFTWPTLGNRDAGNSTTYNPAIPYYSIFQLPTAGECGGVPSGTESYYSFDYGNIHFVCLDSITTDRSATGAMANWVRADLAATSARWIIAYWHRSPYSKGGYDSDANNDQAQMRENFVPILEEYGVDLVLTGDSHNYERSWLMSGHYGTSSTFVGAMKNSTTLGRRWTDGPYVKNAGASPNKDGAVYIVAGNGASLQSTATSSLNHPSMAVNLRVLGTVVIDVNGPQLDVQMVQSTGFAADTFSIVKPYSLTDTDADQLPDEYEVEHGLNPNVPNTDSTDSDADGDSDLREYQTGTHPLDPESKLLTQVSRSISGPYRITFPTAIGMRYTVEKCDDLVGNVWSSISWEIYGTGGVVSVDDTGLPRPAKRYYRVKSRP